MVMNVTEFVQTNSTITNTADLCLSDWSGWTLPNGQSQLRLWRKHGNFVVYIGTSRFVYM